jgi:hypothetical protein
MESPVTSSVCSVRGDDRDATAHRPDARPRDVEAPLGVRSQPVVRGEPAREPVRDLGEPELVPDPARGPADGEHQRALAAGRELLPLAADRRALEQEEDERRRADAQQRVARTEAASGDRLGRGVVAHGHQKRK